MKTSHLPSGHYLGDWGVNPCSLIFPSLRKHFLTGGPDGERPPDKAWRWSVMGCSSTAGGPHGEHVEGELSCTNSPAGCVCVYASVCVCVCVPVCTWKLHTASLRLLVTGSESENRTWWWIPSLFFFSLLLCTQASIPWLMCLTSGAEKMITSLIPPHLAWRKTLRFL